VDARITRYWLVLAGIAAVVLLGAALIGVRLARFVTRPLRGLERAAAAVGEGDLDVRAPELEGPPEVRSLARVFNETVAKLDQLVRSQSEFVADASHELRTPLTALRLQLENGDVENSLREVERLGDLVEGLLALARADAGSSPAAVVDAAAIARERVEHWHALAEERDVTLTGPAGDEQALVRAGSERLVQVLDNLLANALDAAPRGSEVAVSVQAGRSWVELRVRDGGPGLTAEERARAFDRFWRARKGGGGSGLGLAIVRRLVEADGGEVELVDAPGGGLSAVVRLRAAGADSVRTGRDTRLCSGAEHDDTDPSTDGVRKPGPSPGLAGNPWAPAAATTRGAARHAAGRRPDGEAQAREARPRDRARPARAPAAPL
jgi:signal transduction histidine kinase